MPAATARRRTAQLLAILLLSAGTSALVAYKASSALATLSKVRSTGTLAAKPVLLASVELPSWVRPLTLTTSYFGWVLIALLFGVLLGALVEALVPQRWLARTVASGGVRGHILAVAAGAPLMLCSCCVAPLFDGVYHRTRRLAPSIALLLASPALNPFALGLTFLLFPASIAWGRLLAALVLVLAGSAGIGVMLRDRAAECAPVLAPESGREVARAVGAALATVARRTLPAIALGALLSAILGQAAPFPALSGAGAAGVVAAAALAVPLAFPTFGEIPVALALQLAGAPAGAVLAVLVAGPAINLPSLLSISRTASWRAAAATAACVFAVAASAGLLLRAAG